MTITSISPHADDYPMLSDEALQELIADIAENGLRDPITVTPDGVLLDGRNRWKACQALGIEPEVEIYEGDDLGAFVRSRNERRHQSTGSRAMSTALSLQRDGYRENGRWKRGSVEISQNSGLSRWSEAIRCAGVVLDFAPELAVDVVAGIIALDAAYRQADQLRQSVEAEKIAKKAAEKRAREEAKAAAERDARMLATLTDDDSKYLGNIEAGQMSIKAAFAAHMADTENERRKQREIDDGRRNELRHIQESVRYLGEVNGKQAAGMFLSDAYQHQARLSPEGMWIKRKHLIQAREFIDTLIGAIHE